MEENNAEILNIEEAQAAQAAAAEFAAPAEGADFIVPAEGAAPAAPAEPAEEFEPDPAAREAAIIKSAKAVYSRIGFRAVLTMVITVVAGVVVILLGSFAIISSEDSVTMVLILSMVSTHLIAIPIGCRMMRSMPVFEAEPDRLGFGALLKCIPVCMFFAYGGNLIGNELNELLCRLLGAPYSDPVSGIASPDMPFFGMLIPLVIVGPLMEELLFRKVMIDRMRGYGEKLAIVTSALMFGMFHGNIVQFTYASLLGLVLGYVYTRTQSLGKCFFLHAFVNFYSGVLSTKLASGERVEYFLNKIDDGTWETALAELEDPQVMAFCIYAAMTLVLAVAGIVIFIVSLKRLRFKTTQLQVPKGKGFSCSWLNPGMIVFALSCAGYMVFTVLSTKIKYL